MDNARCHILFNSHAKRIKCSRLKLVLIFPAVEDSFPGLIDIIIVAENALRRII
jgi:hypothetical protein